MSGPEVIMLLLWFLWAISWLAADAWSTPAAKRSPAGGELLYRGLIGIGYVVLFGVYYNGYLHGPMRLWLTPNKLGWVLVGLTLLSFAFAWWARIHLGKLWSSSVTRKSDHRIVDSGPYGFVRHPIYTAILSGSLWLAIEKGTIPAFGGFALVVAGYWVKARIEEGFLRAELGASAYDSYSTRTPMLVPFVKI